MLRDLVQATSLVVNLTHWRNQPEKRSSYPLNVFMRSLRAPSVMGFPCILLDQLECKGAADKQSCRERQMSIVRDIVPC